SERPSGYPLTGRLDEGLLARPDAVVGREALLLRQADELLQLALGQDEGDEVVELVGRDRLDSLDVDADCHVRYRDHRQPVRVRDVELELLTGQGRLRAVALNYRHVRRRDGEAPAEHLPKGYARPDGDRASVAIEGGEALGFLRWQGRDVRLGLGAGVE